MPWLDSSPTSRVFLQAVLNPLTQKVNPGSITAPTGYTDLVATDVVNVALFNNSVSPNACAAVGSTGYNTGTWLTANEVTDATNWVAGGRALGSKTYSVLGVNPGSQTTPGGVNFDAADLSGGGTLTITNAYGCLVYDNSISGGTVAKQGLCFNYFGGAQSVTSGSFTVVWDSTGVFKFTD